MALSIPEQEASLTAFEQIWHEPDGHLFKSERHGVMAIASVFPRLPLEVVVAPREGSVGNDIRFSNLPSSIKRLLHELADAVEEKIAQHCEPTQRPITHTEGYHIRDHAHIVLAAAERKQGIAMYNGDRLGAAAVQRTVELITFSPVEAELLEVRLDEVHQI